MKFSVDGMEGLLCCPSYKRPKNIETRKLLPNIRVYVMESEAAASRENNPGADVQAMPDKVQGNISRVRNWILDQNKGKIVCMVDDDLNYLGFWEKRNLIKLQNEAEYADFLIRYSRMAREMGTVLWGVNVTSDKQYYREYTPFSLTSYIGAPLMVHIDTPLRFDERLPLKEDFDFSLQALNRYRKILRVNKYHYQVRQGCSVGLKAQAGGCASYRTVQAEKDQIEVLTKKWGTKIVHMDSLDSSRNHKMKKERVVDFNPIIRVPIQGV